MSLVVRTTETAKLRQELEQSTPHALRNRHGAPDECTATECQSVNLVNFFPGIRLRAKTFVNAPRMSADSC